MSTSSPHFAIRHLSFTSKVGFATRRIVNAAQHKRAMLRIQRPSISGRQGHQFPAHSPPYPSHPFLRLVSMGSLEEEAAGAPVELHRLQLAAGEPRHQQLLVAGPAPDEAREGHHLATGTGRVPSKIFKKKKKTHAQVGWAHHHRPSL